MARNTDRSGQRESRREESDGGGVQEERKRGVNERRCPLSRNQSMTSAQRRHICMMIETETRIKTRDELLDMQYYRAANPC